jgi:hypothetical protein
MKFIKVATDLILSETKTKKEMHYPQYFQKKQHFYTMAWLEEAD